MAKSRYVDTDCSCRFEYCSARFDLDLLPVYCQFYPFIFTHVVTSLWFDYSIELAGLVTCPALDAFFLVDNVHFLHFSRYAVNRAGPCACGAAYAFDRIYAVPCKVLAGTGLAVLALHVSLVFVIKVLHSGKNRIRSRLPESAE